MIHHILFYKDVPNPRGYPDEWPAVVNTYHGAAPNPQAPWVAMTDGQLTGHKALLQEAYDAVQTVVNRNTKLVHKRNQISKTIARRKWEEETRHGITLGNAKLLTDDRSQLKFAGAALRAMMDENYVAEWKIAPDHYEFFDAPTIIAAFTAVSDHVAACFKREQELYSELNAVPDVLEDLLAFEAVAMKFWAD